MNTANNAELEPLRAIVSRGEVIEFKDEGDTPEGIDFGCSMCALPGILCFRMDVG